MKHKLRILCLSLCFCSLILLICSFAGCSGEPSVADHLTFEKKYYLMEDLVSGSNTPIEESIYYIFHEDGTAEFFHDLSGETDIYPSGKKPYTQHYVVYMKWTAADNEGDTLIAVSNGTKFFDDHDQEKKQDSQE